MGMPDVIIDGEVLEVEAPTQREYTWHSYFDEGLAAEPPNAGHDRLAPANPRMFPDGGVTQVTLTHDTEAHRSPPGSSAARSPTPAAGTPSSSAT